MESLATWQLPLHRPASFLSTWSLPHAVTKVAHILHAPHIPSSMGCSGLWPRLPSTFLAYTVHTGPHALLAVLTFTSVQIWVHPLT